MKPLLRRASAYEALEKYPLAYVDYKTVLQIDDSVKAALEGINSSEEVGFLTFGKPQRES